MGWVSTERNHDEQPITVGVIDDDPMICQMMRLILEDYSSGRISVAFACTNEQTPSNMRRTILLMSCWLISPCPAWMALKPLVSSACFPILRMCLF